MSKVSFSAVTVINLGFLARAEVMFASLARFHPEVPRLALLIDRWPQDLPRPQHFEVLTLEELGPPDMRRRLFRHSRFDRLLTWKSLALQHALQRYPQCEIAFFLDSDMEILGSLDPLLELMSKASVLLTPHILRPSEELATHLSMSRVGIYNAGFVGVTRDRAWPFLEWWDQVLQRHCCYDPYQSLFHEQRWLDQVPALFQDVSVCRYPGANLAYWNLAERQFDGPLEQPGCEGESALFFHYSGWSAEAPEQLSVHLGGRYKPAADSLLGKLLERYQQQVMASPYLKLAGSDSSFDLDSRAQVITDCDSLFFCDVLEPFVDQDFDPYLGLPNLPEHRLLSWLLQAGQLMGSQESPRQTPLYRTLCEWARKRLQGKMNTSVPTGRSS